MYSSFMPDMVGIELTPDAAIPLTARVGFTGFDLRLNRFVDAVATYGVAKLADLMGDHSLRPGYASLVSGKVNVSEAEWSEHIRDLPRRAEIASRLGYTRSTSVVLPFSDELPFDRNFDLHVRRTREACAILHDYGIAFGLEYVSPKTRRRGKPHEFVHDLRGLRALIAAVDAPGTGMMIDTFHWACAEETADDLTELSPSDIVAIHVNDLVAGRSLDEQTIMERELPGTTGLARVEVFLAALAEIGYDGPVTAEPTHPRWATTPAEEAAAATARSVNEAVDRAAARKDPAS